MDQVTQKISDYWTRHPEQQQEKKKAFVETLRQNGNVRSAAELACVDRRIVYSWRSSDPDFRAAWDAAKEDATDEVENALYDMATSRKNVVATIFYLKNNREQYRDRVTIDVPMVQRDIEERLQQLLTRAGSTSANEVVGKLIGSYSREPQEDQTTTAESDPPEREPELKPQS